MILGLVRRMNVLARLGLAITFMVWPSCASPQAPGTAAGPGGAATDASTEVGSGDANTGGTTGEAGAGGSADGGGAAGSPSDAGVFLMLYASPAGAGDACTEDHPCLLTTARDKVRTMSVAMTGDIVVTLLGGTYQLDATFELTQIDSGKNGHRVIYQAYPNHVPVLSGGREVEGWDTVDANAGIVRAQVPPDLRTRQVYVNGRRAQRARGELNPPDWVETTSGYTAPNTAIAGWAHPEDVEIVQLAWWKNFRCGVASAHGTTVTMDQPCWELAQLHQGFDMGLPSWVENARELLDAPGEWYLDEHEGSLYYVLREGETAASLSVVVPRLETLVRVAGTLDEPVHDIELRGLTFSHATWLRPSTAEGYPALQAGYTYTGTAANPSLGATPGNVELSRAERVTLAENVFEHLGAYALALEYGCQNVAVVGNVFRDVSSGAVRVGSVDLPNTTDPREVTKNNEVRSNVVTDTGREYFDGVGIFVGYTDGTRIVHNALHRLPYTAISVGWGWSTDETVARNNEVAHNLVSYAMQRLDDGGMTYALSRQPNSALHDNHFHDQVHVYGAIYLDQGSMYWNVQHNVISSAPYWFLLQPGIPPPAQQNVLRNNFSDSPAEVCCGALGCCTDLNLVSHNTVFPPGRWPPEARYVMHRAGLEPAFRQLWPTSYRIEAEDYAHGGEGVGYHDITSSNEGGAYRGDAVDVYRCASCSNDHTVGYTQTGEWLDYHVDAPLTGEYDFTFHVATQSDTCAIELLVDGGSAGSVALPNTGSWGAYEPAELAHVWMNAGTHRVQLRFTGGFNFDAFDVTWNLSTCEASGLPAALRQGRFDGTGAVNTLFVYETPACWQVETSWGKMAWLRGWGNPTRLHVADFDGDGLDDVLAITQAQLSWDLALSSGRSFTGFTGALTGWGAGTYEVIGDLDGDGRKDVTVLYSDGATWRWHVARSLGYAFEPHPNAHTGTDPGAAACAKDIDNDGADEIVVSGTGQAMCADYDMGSGTFAVVQPCSESCP